MPNTLLTSDIILNESLMILHQKLTYIGSINRSYDSQFANDGAKKGDTIRLRLPNEFVVREGAALNAQDIQERNTSLTVDRHRGVDMQFTSTDLTLDIDRFAERYIEPAMSVLAANIEADALEMRKDVYQQVGTTGSAVGLEDFLNGRKALNEALAPMTKRVALMNNQDNVDLVSDGRQFFNDRSEISKQYKEGYVGRTSGFDFSETTHLVEQIRGTGENYTAVGADQTGSAINIGGGAGAINKGEIVTFAGVYRVHPETKARTSTLQQFVVTQDVADGDTVINLSPAIEVTGARQNVSNGIADAAPMTIFGTPDSSYTQSLVYTPEAFTFATADLIKPKGVDMCSRKNMEGISMRLIRDYDINSDNFPCRLDILYGYNTNRAQLASRIAAN